MARPEKIPLVQLERVHRLEDRMLRKLRLGDFRGAKVVLDELKLIYNRYNQNSRLMENYLRFYEAALDEWELDLARSGFEFVANNVRPNTRLYLEAKTLLAISFIRKKDVQSAAPHMAAVLRNETAIKSEKTRSFFRAETIKRFGEEGALVSLAELYPNALDPDEIHFDAMSLLKEVPREDELLKGIGQEVPQAAREFILKVDAIAKNQLPSGEKLMLPGPSDFLKDNVVGDVLFGGLKRKLYRSICNPDAEIYKAWVKDGIGALTDRNFLASAVVAALADLRIGLAAIAVRVVVLQTQKGLKNFCELNRPLSVMNLRRKRD